MTPAEQLAKWRAECESDYELWDSTAKGLRPDWVQFTRGVRPFKYFGHGSSWDEDVEHLQHDLAANDPYALEIFQAFVAFRIKRRMK